MNSDVEAKGEAVAPEWKPTKNEWLVMISLSFISLMVALDATVLVTVLPVGDLCRLLECRLLTMNRRLHIPSTELRQKPSGQVPHSMCSFSR
jgi:hypothetical protein